jgi:hypothetical protein
MIATIVPRGCGKTVTGTKAATLWTHLDQPDLASVVAAEDKDLAQDILGAMKEVLSGTDPNSWFCWLYGQWKTSDRDWLKGKVTHAYRRSTAISEPSIASASVETGITGYHPDDCTWDDPLSANKLRDSGGHLAAAHTAFDATYYALSTDGWMAMTLTRYLDDDIAGRHLKKEGVAEWHGMDPPNRSYFEDIPLGRGRWHVWFMQIEDANGEPTLPEVMSADEIALAKKRDPIDFACQYMNDPQHGEAVQITEAHVNSLRIDRSKLRDIPIAFASVHLDTAFKTEKTIAMGDDSAIVTFLHDSRPNGLVYLDSAHASNEWRDTQFFAKLISVLLDLRRRGIWVKCITDEVEPSGKTRELFKNHLIGIIRQAGIPSVPKIIQLTRQGTKKEQRLRDATSFWSDGYVRVLVHCDQAGNFIDSTCPGFVKYRSQLVKGRGSIHDDIADAGSDVWSSDVWRRPTSATYGLARDEGQDVINPTDYGLKNFLSGRANAALNDLLIEQDTRNRNYRSVDMDVIDSPYSNDPI